MSEPTGWALEPAAPQPASAPPSAGGTTEAPYVADENLEQSETPTARLARIAWSVTTVVFAVAGLILLLGSYYGYASVTFAVAVAAGINVL